jgi:hypothetical protein
MSQQRDVIDRSRARIEQELPEPPDRRHRLYLSLRSMSSQSVRSTSAGSFGSAASVLRLEDDRGEVASHLTVCSIRGALHHDWHNFGGFVEALERHETIEGVEFREIQFDAHKPFAMAREEEVAAMEAAFRAAEDDVERMFGSVLPSHPSLREVKFVSHTLQRGSLPPALVQLLVARWRSEMKSRCRGAGDTARVPSRRPPEATATARPKLPLRLEIGGYALDDVVIQELAQALREGALASLVIRQCHVDSAQFRLLIESAADGQQLTCLELHELGIARYNFLKIDKDTFANGVIERTSARVLGLESGRWTDAAYESLTRQMRTNTAVASLRIRDTGRSKRLVDWILELLTTYNFTLQVVFPIRPSDQGRVDELLRRNSRVRAVHEHLERVHYVLEERALWPRAISQVARFPPSCTASCARATSMASQISWDLGARRTGSGPLPWRR